MHAHILISTFLLAPGCQAALLFSNGAPDNVTGRNMTAFRSADDFTLPNSATVAAVRFWWNPGNGLPVSDFSGTITYAFYNDNAGSLGALAASGTVSAWCRFLRAPR